MKSIMATANTGYKFKGWYKCALDEVDTNATPVSTKVVYSLGQVKEVLAYTEFTHIALNKNVPVLLQNFAKKYVTVIMDSYTFC